MGRRLPQPQVIYNEEIHIFLPVGPGRYQHYIRTLGNRMFGAERLAEENSYTLEEAQVWCAIHNPPPVNEIEVQAVHAYGGDDERLIGEAGES